MALILQILEGDTPAAAVPVFATRDPAILAAVAEAVDIRLAGADCATMLRSKLSVRDAAGTPPPRRRRGGRR